MTPFIGGMLADRLLGARRAVVLGGLLMAAGHLMMTIEFSGRSTWRSRCSSPATASSSRTSRRWSASCIRPGARNATAASPSSTWASTSAPPLSPLLCGYVGETYGWHYGFGLATIGMLTGVAVFVAPIRLTQLLILGGALTTGDRRCCSCRTIRTASRSTSSSAPRSSRRASSRSSRSDAEGCRTTQVSPPASAAGPAAWPVYVGTLVALPIFMLLVQRGHDQRRGDGCSRLLLSFGGGAFLWLIVEAFRSQKVERERMFVVLILMFFSMLFWAFFEQAGSSVNNFTDRNVDRVIEERVATPEDVGNTIEMRVPTADQRVRHRQPAAAHPGTARTPKRRRCRAVHADGRSTACGRKAS